jgi:pyridoxamine 5'-phosphate oxidase family protein
VPDFSELELQYLASQRLGRLATIPADGYPQNNPVGFAYNAELGTIDIVGYNLAASRKFANIRANPKATLVVDDIRSTSPWWVRGVEIRGDAEALTEPGELIRLHPTRIRSWGLTSKVP